MLSKSRQILPSHKHGRIKKHSEFERVLHNANGLNNKWFVIYLRKNEGNVARLGIITSKKIMTKAVTRNFAKRLIREVFRHSFLVCCALDVVVRVRRPLSQEASKEGRLALTQLLQTVQM